MKSVGRKFGSIAIEMGFLSRDQLKEALDLQAAERAEGRDSRLIGEILCDLNYLTKEQIDEVVEVLSHTMHSIFLK